MKNLKESIDELVEMYGEINELKNELAFYKGKETQHFAAAVAKNSIEISASENEIFGILKKKYFRHDISSWNMPGVVGDNNTIIDFNDWIFKMPRDVFYGETFDDLPLKDLISCFRDQFHDLYNEKVAQAKEDLAQKKAESEEESA